MHEHRMDKSESKAATRDAVARQQDDDEAAPSMDPGRRIQWWRYDRRDWLELLRDWFNEIRNDNVPLVSAGVAFYATLGVIPAAVMAITLYGMFTDRAEVERQITRILEVLPADAAGVLADQIRPIATSPSAALSVGFVLGALGLLWTASNAIRSIIRAVVVAYDLDEQRSRFETRIASIGLTIVAIAVAGVMIGIVAVLPAWFALAQIDFSAAALRWVMLVLLVAGIATVLYRYAPPRDAPAWGSLVPAVVFAAIGWIAISIGFSLYVSNFGSYNQTYGALGAAVIVLMWFFLSALVIIAGAELASAMEKQHSGQL